MRKYSTFDGKLKENFLCNYLFSWLPYECFFLPERVNEKATQSRDSQSQITITPVRGGAWILRLGKKCIMHPLIK